MAYPLPFYRLVINGNLYAEKFSTSLNFYAGSSKATDATITSNLATVVKNWWSDSSTTGPKLPTAAALTEIKFNRIATTGHYADPVSQTYTFPTPWTGGAAHDLAPQLTAVVSLRTAFDRGLANRGRMYLPAPAGYNVPSTDGRATTADATRVATAVTNLINNLHPVLATWSGGGDFVPKAAVFSDVRGGAWHYVTRTEAGRVIDTMRSRRTSLAEAYQVSTTAIA